MSKFKVYLASAALSLTLPSFGVGLALADPPGVSIEVPFFYPATAFRYDDDGYYRTHEGRYYHYDKGRDGWHWGKSHREGLRYERLHHHER